MTPAPIPKREKAAAAAERVGLTAILERLPSRDALLVINYHRLGDALASPYDSDVYSATPEIFERHVTYLKARYRIVSLDEAIEIAEGRRSPRGTAVLLTFDDGYVDCYRIAFPVLRSHHVPATFFLSTGLVGSDVLPWWDRIAYAIRRTRKPLLHLTYPTPCTLNIAEDGASAAIRAALRLYKSPDTRDGTRFLNAIVSEAGVAHDRAAERLFMNWTEAAEMCAGGMDFGSHTHMHPLLSKLTLAEQIAELDTSRGLLQERLGRSIAALAFPVGSRTAFNDLTFEALRATGYRAAFSYHGGLNRPGRINRFDIKRVSADHDVSWPRFRLQCALAPQFNGYWF